jgi:hypothetical protein
MMRAFRASEATYEAVRLSLDAAWGHSGGVTCIAPATVAPRDAEDMVLFCDRDMFFEYAAVQEHLPPLLASGAVEEIDPQVYFAVLPVVEA